MEQDNLRRSVALAVIFMIIVVASLAGCAIGSTMAVDIPNVQFDRETHPNAKLLKLARDVPGFGGKFFDDQGRLNVYMLDPENVSPEARIALADAFAVGAELLSS